MFTEEDVKRAGQFGQFLMKAKFDMPVAEWIEFNRLLIWYNGMVKKVNDHVFELKGVVEPTPVKAKKSK